MYGFYREKSHVNHLWKLKGWVPWVIKAEFLLTIYPYNIKETSDENKEKY